MVNWEFMGNGTWVHRELGRVFLNEDYGRTYRAVPSDYRNPARNANGRAIRFRSKDAAMAHLAKLKSTPPALRRD